MLGTTDELVPARDLAEACTPSALSKCYKLLAEPWPKHNQQGQSHSCRKSRVLGRAQSLVKPGCFLQQEATGHQLAGGDTYKLVMHVRTKQDQRGLLRNKGKARPQHNHALTKTAAFKVMSARPGAEGATREHPPAAVNISHSDRDRGGPAKEGAPPDPYLASPGATSRGGWGPFSLALGRQVSGWVRKPC